MPYLDEALPEIATVGYFRERGYVHARTEDPA